MASRSGTEGPDLGPAADSLSNTNHWDSYGGPLLDPQVRRGGFPVKTRGK